MLSYSGIKERKSKRERIKNMTAKFDIEKFCGENNFKL